MDENGRRTDVYNGNRYIIIKKPGNVNSIPESIPVTHPTTNATLNIKVTFAGQKRHCPTCNDFHIDGCPYLREFYEAKEKKEKMRENNEIQTKIVADSTLRSIDPTGLKADVLCAPGAGFGFIAEVLHDDPDCENANNIIMAGGTNDVYNEDVELEKFAFAFDKGISKVVEFAENYPNKQVKIITPHTG